MSRWNCRINYEFGKIGEGRNTRFRNSLVYQMEVTPRTPDPMDMVAVVNDSDPLNIYTGNPDLRLECRINNTLTYELRYAPLHALISAVPPQYPA